MSQHARPLPSRPTAGPRDPVLRPAAALTTPLPKVAPRGPASADGTTTPDAIVPRPEPRPAVATAAPRPDHASANAAPDDRAWHRQEPWLTWVLAAFVPLMSTLAIPDAAWAAAAPLRHAALGVSALCLVVGLALLLRQGPFRPTPARSSVGGRRSPRRR